MRTISGDYDDELRGCDCSTFKSCEVCRAWSAERDREFAEFIASGGKVNWSGGITFTTAELEKALQDNGWPEVEKQMDALKEAWRLGMQKAWENLVDD